MTDRSRDDQETILYQDARKEAIRRFGKVCIYCGVRVRTEPVGPERGAAMAEGLKIFSSALLRPREIRVHYRFDSNSAPGSQADPQRA